MRWRSRFQPKWLEIYSIGSTVALTIGGCFCVFAIGRWVEREWAYCTPAPTEFVLDLVKEPVSLSRLLLLIPTALAFAGASANGRRRKVLGPALLVLAPQTALVGSILAL